LTNNEICEILDMREKKKKKIKKNEKIIKKKKKKNKTKKKKKTNTKPTQKMSKDLGGPTTIGVKRF